MRWEKRELIPQIVDEIDNSGNIPNLVIARIGIAMLQGGPCCGAAPKALKSILTCSTCSSYVWGKGP